MNIVKQTRLTSQRVKILDYLRSVKSHPTAEMVYEAVKKDLPTISLATVYRNLHLLAEQGLIIKLEVNGEFRFDADTCNHIHCICDSCNKIIEFADPSLSECAFRSLKSKDFSATCLHMVFRGKCKDCGGETHD